MLLGVVVPFGVNREEKIIPQQSNQTKYSTFSKVNFHYYKKVLFVY